MSKFDLLREHQLAPRFRKALRAAQEGVIAVPYWGKGAISLLGLRKGDNIRIICNIDHIGCNPWVIDDIRKLKIKVWTHPRLHAKIYATSTLAIIGSSNVSSNGLAVEGSGARGWIEINVCSSANSFIAEVRDLFETIFKDPETRSVRAEDVKRAKARREKFPPVLSELPRGQSLFDAARSAPEAFSSVYVAAYTSSLSPTAKTALEGVKSNVAPDAGVEFSLAAKLWGYQFDDIPKDAWLIDLSLRRATNPKVYGSARVVGSAIPITSGGEPETDLSLAVKGPIQIGGRDYALTENEKQQLVGSASRISKVSKGKLLPLSEVLMIVDRARKGRIAPILA